MHKDLEQGLEIWTTETGFATIHPEMLNGEAREEFLTFGRADTPLIFRTFPENSTLAFAYDDENNAPILDSHGRHRSVDISPASSALGTWVAATIQEVDSDERGKRTACEPLIRSDPETLSFTGYGFTSLPYGLHTLQNLQDLFLSRNRLTSLPAGLGAAPNLRQLILARNRLTSLRAELGNLQNLHTLTINRNNLTSLRGELGNAPNLTMLCADSNRLTSVSAGVGNARKLDTLILARNQLRSVPAELADPPSLRNLDLSFNHLQIVPDAFIRQGLTVYGMGEQTLPDIFPELNLNPSQKLWIASEPQEALAETLRNAHEDQRSGIFAQAWQAWKDASEAPERPDEERNKKARQNFKDIFTGKLQKEYATLVDLWDRSVRRPHSPKCRGVRIDDSVTGVLLQCADSEVNIPTEQAESVFTYLVPHLEHGGQQWKHFSDLPVCIDPKSYTLTFQTYFLKNDLQQQALLRDGDKKLKRARLNLLGHPRNQVDDYGQAAKAFSATFKYNVPAPPNVAGDLREAVQGLLGIDLTSDHRDFQHGDTREWCKKRQSLDAEQTLVTLQDYAPEIVNANDPVYANLTAKVDAWKKERQERENEAAGELAKRDPEASKRWESLCALPSKYERQKVLSDSSAMHGISRELRDLHIDNHLRFLSSGEQELIEAAQQRSEKPSAADRWDTFCDVRNVSKRDQREALQRRDHELLEDVSESLMDLALSRYTRSQSRDISPAREDERSRPGRASNLLRSITPPPAQGGPSRSARAAG
jgi:Leucine rich repeat